jgi:hypothetical protein
LQLLGLYTNGEQSGAEVSVATTNVTVDETTRDISKETSDNWNTVFTSDNLAGESLRSCAVELVVETACGIIVE